MDITLSFFRLVQAAPLRNSLASRHTFRETGQSPSQMHDGGLWALMAGSKPPTPNRPGLERSRSNQARPGGGKVRAGVWGLDKPEQAVADEIEKQHHTLALNPVVDERSSPGVNAQTHSSS